jgi:NhaC family Na+:H+ antiporter
MEQEEKKQKSQAAENQASCSSLQPVEPHPFISVIPLAVLITLIVLVVKIFPDDALAGASQVALMIATEAYHKICGRNHGWNRICCIFRVNYQN